MTNEMFYERICTMLREYDLNTGSQYAPNVIDNPEQWTFKKSFPFYAVAAEVLVDIRNKLDTKITSHTTLAAITRICKNCNNDHPSTNGIITYGDRFVICDGYRLLRLSYDIPSLPHVTTSDFDVYSVTEGVCYSGEALNLPSVGEIRAFIAAHRVPDYKRGAIPPYCVDDCVWFNPQYLLDMIQALPGCTAHKPKRLTAPIYFDTISGDDGFLLPVRPSKEVS